MEAHPVLTQHDLARLVGLSQTRISEYENGDVENMPLAIALAIAHVFGVSVEQLVPGLLHAIPERIKDRDPDEPEVVAIDGEVTDL